MNATLRDFHLGFVFDLSYNPFSVGDFLVFCLACRTSLAVMGSHQKPIFVLIGNEESHGVSEVYKGSDAEKFFITRLAQVAPLVTLIHLETSFLVLRDLQDYKLLTQLGKPIRVIWPPPEQLRKKAYTFYASAELAINLESQLNSTQINFPEYIDTTVKHFTRTLLMRYKRIVTVNLRIDNEVSPIRNSNLLDWNSFFANAVGDGTLFVYIASRSQVCDSIRKRSNVVWSGDLREDILIDLALMKASAFHLGASSGLIGFFLFETNKPVNVFSSDVFLHKQAYSKILCFDSDNLAHKRTVRAPSMFFNRNESLELISDRYHEARKKTDKL